MLWEVDNKGLSSSGEPVTGSIGTHPTVWDIYFGNGGWGAISSACRDLRIRRDMGYQEGAKQTDTRPTRFWGRAATENLEVRNKEANVNAV
ncbi:unnamed protein product [Aspergillus oryzae var. brunneus]|uniref:Unnamed protein product n=1 Tax=Aspergillus oryzae var. brunneus TaxID=332754 RepID=A0ABQ6KVV7_ASPOZ|nr:unnamed protein product [Aspergillus oryzae var. brunneus]